MVAAMRRHALDAKVLGGGCGALYNLACGDEMHKQEIMDAGGLTATVTAMGQHTAVADVQRNGCRLLQSLVYGNAARTQAVRDAGGVAAAAASGMVRRTEYPYMDGCKALRGGVDGSTAALLLGDDNPYYI